MSKGKGKEIATKLDWKEQLAKLDQEFGWDEQAGTDWADDCEPEKQEVHTPTRPPPSQHNNKNVANPLQSTKQDCVDDSMAEPEFDPRMAMTDDEYAACYNAQVQFDNNSNGAHHGPSDHFEEDDITSAEMQRRIWDAAVQESLRSGQNNVPYEGPSTYATEYNDYQEQAYSAHQQQEDYDEENDNYYGNGAEEGHQEERIQPKSRLTAYLYHRFGPDIRYENRCPCHEHLCDAEEERKKYEREYYAHQGRTTLMRDRCILLPHPQAALPGNEHVDKPVLTITTAEGEMLYPHDMEEYPEMVAAAEWHGPGVGWGGAAPPEEGDVVPYEDEDGADI